MFLTSQPARSEITVAVAAPLSGRHAAEGRAIVQSVTWAAAALNASGGVAGETVVVRSADDGCDDGRATVAAGQLIAYAPAVVIGHPCGGPAQAAASIYAAAGTLLIAVAPRHPELTRNRAGPTILRLAGRDDLQSASTAAYLAAAYGGKRIAIVHDRTRYARQLVEGLKRARGGTAADPIPEFGIVASSKDYAATIGALRALRSEVVYFAGFPAEAAALWGQFRAADALPDLVGSDALANADTELRRLSEGKRFVARVLRPYTALDSELAKPLIGRLVASGSQPTDSAVAGYAAVELWAGAVMRAGSRDAAAVQRQLQSASVPSILGAVSFDADGDARIPSFEIASFADGRLTTEAIVLPEDRRTAPQKTDAHVSNDGAIGRPVAASARLSSGNQGDGPRVVSPPLPVRHPLRRDAVRTSPRR